LKERSYCTYSYFSIRAACLVYGCYLFLGKFSLVLVGLAMLRSSDDEDNSPVMAAASILASAAADISGAKQETSSTEPKTRETGASHEQKDDDEEVSTVTHERRWESMFAKLCAYKAKHGALQVVQRAFGQLLIRLTCST
jgi:hypothetical protein